MEATFRTLNAVMSDNQEELSEPEREEASVTLPPSSCSLMDTCCASVTSLSLSSNIHPPKYSSTSSSATSSSVVSLTPPLPPSVELSDVLTGTRLTLDIYQGGAAALPLLWRSVPHQVKGIQYLKLGSEDKAGLEAALDVLPHLAELRLLAIRGTPHMFICVEGRTTYDRSPAEQAAINTAPCANRTFRGPGPLWFSRASALVQSVSEPCHRCSWSCRRCLAASDREWSVAAIFPGLSRTE